MDILAAARRHKAALIALVAFGLVAALFVGRRVAGTSVQVQTPSRTRMIHSVVTTGRVRPLRVRLAPIGSGTIRELPVREGSRVVAGQVLLQLDDQEAVAALADANAQLAQATAGQRKIRTITRAESEESALIAKTRLADAERDLERIRQLHTAGTVSKADLEDAETTATLAKSALRSAEAQVRDLKSGGATARDREAAIQQAQAYVALAKARLGYTRLVAPVDGIVIARSAEVGDAIAGNTVVLEIAATAKTELVVEPDERNLSLLALGQPAIASAEAFANQTFAAEINFIAPVVDSRRGTIEVRLLVPEPPDYLRPDMTVSVDIEVDRKENALVLPIDAALGLASPTPYVLVVESNRAVRRDISVGIRDIKNFEVITGITETDQVIVDPTKVSVGDRVRAKVGTR